MSKITIMIKETTLFIKSSDLVAMAVRQVKLKDISKPEILKMAQQKQNLI